MEPDFENTSEALVPVIEPARWIAEMEQFDIPLPVHQPFVAGLFISYQLDFPEFQVSLSPQSIQQFMGEFNPSIERIHEVAIHNLRQRTITDEFDFSDQKTIQFKASDRFTASRILLPELLSAWETMVSGKLLVGIPHRDLLLAFGDGDAEHTQSMLAYIKREFEEHAFGLYDGLLAWNQGNLAIFQNT